MEQILGYIIGALLLAFFGREVYNKRKVNTLKKDAEETRGALRKEKVKNANLKVEVKRKAYYDRRNARGQFIGKGK